MSAAEVVFIAVVAFFLVGVIVGIAVVYALSARRVGRADQRNNSADTVTAATAEAPAGRFSNAAPDGRRSLTGHRRRPAFGPVTHDDKLHLVGPKGPERTGHK